MNIILYECSGDIESSYEGSGDEDQRVSYLSYLFESTK